MVAVLAAIWAVYSHFQQQRDKRRHEAIIEDLRKRSAAMTELSGILREIQHCTDDHGGETVYQRRIDQKIDEARRFVLRHDRLLGEDVIAAVQHETKLARDVFKHQLEGAAIQDDRRALQAARTARVAILNQLATRVDFPPPRGSLLPL